MAAPPAPISPPDLLLGCGIDCAVMNHHGAPTFARPLAVVLQRGFLNNPLFPALAHIRNSAGFCHKRMIAYIPVVVGSSLVFGSPDLTILSSRKKINWAFTKMLFLRTVAKNWHAEARYVLPVNGRAETRKIRPRHGRCSSHSDCRR